MYEVIKAFNDNGTDRVVGDVIELTEEAAKPLIESGDIKLKEEAGASTSGDTTGSTSGDTTGSTSGDVDRG